MSQLNLEATTTQKNQEVVGHDNALIKAVWPTTGDKPFSGISPDKIDSAAPLLKAGILPDFQLTGFDQNGTKKNETTIDSLIDKIKGIFGQQETLEDQIKGKVVSDLKPDEKKAYDDETKKMEAYKKSVAHWSTLMMYPAPPYPDAPQTPMHSEVDKRTQAEERKIATEVRSQMTPEERKRMDKQLDDYEGVGKPLNPGPIEIARRTPERPEPGNALKDYWDKIREATDKFTQK